MAIQAQFYPANDMSVFYNNGYFAGELIESCFNSQQKHQHQQQQQQQLEQRLQQLYNESQRPIDLSDLVYNNSSVNSKHHPSSNPPNFGVHYEMEREQIDQDIDKYIVLQNAKLRHMIQEQGKQQVAALLRRVESHSLCMLREKDQEIAQAAKRRVELEDYLRRLEAENQAWQRLAQENEAMALSLQNTLQEMRERGSYGVVVADDAESCCDEWKGKKEEEEGENESGEFEQITRDIICKSCHSRKSCYLFLPCRHLSSCKACDAFLQACPVCRMPKKASIEILIF